MHSDTNVRHIVFFKLILSLIFVIDNGSVLADERTPIQTLELYYQAVKSKNCAHAVLLRPGYSIKSCKGISNVTITDISQLKSDDDRAIFLVDIKLSHLKSAKEGKFLGYLALKYHKGQWLIGQDSYAKSRENFGLDEYIEWLDSRKNIWFADGVVPKNRINQAFEQSKSIKDDIQNTADNTPPKDEQTSKQNKIQQVTNFQIPDHKPPTPSPRRHLQTPLR